MVVEKLKLVIADGQQRLGYVSLAIYWTKHVGRDLIKEVFENLSENCQDSWFSKILETKKSSNWEYTQEHFIFKRKGDGQYTIEDRNNNPLTYLNNEVVGPTPKQLNNGDVITIPLVKNGVDQACYIQVNIIQLTPKTPSLKQLVICQNTKKGFIVNWEEDPESRHHVSTKIETVAMDPQEMRSQTYQNLRMGADVPCPYCDNQHLIFCPPCNAFICYDGIATKVKCPSCNKKYRLKDMEGNIDIQTF